MYTVDRWAVEPGQGLIVNNDKTVTVYGGCIQILDQDVGNNVVASLGIISGEATASYDPGTKIFRIHVIGESAIIKWAKLEYGKIATPYVEPYISTEDEKCMRFYQRINLGQPILAIANGDTSTLRISFNTQVIMRNTPTADFSPIYGNYTWSLTCIKLNESGNIKLTTPPSIDELIRLTNTNYNIKLKTDSTEFVVNNAYVIISAGGFFIDLNAEIK